MTADRNPLDAEVVDISPLECPSCRASVDLEDAFCGSCGADLLLELPLLCHNCGKGLPLGTKFCTSCGTIIEEAPAAETQVTAEIPKTRLIITTPAIAPPPPPRLAPRRSRRKLLWGGLAAALLIAALGVGAWYLTRPDLAAYDRAMRSAIELLADTSSAVEDVSGPEDLDVLSTRLDELESELEAVGDSADDVDSAAHREAVVSVVTVLDGVLAELNRLASLPSAEAESADLGRMDAASDDLYQAIDDALRTQSLEPRLAIPILDVTVIGAALSDLAAYREEVLAERTRIKRANDRRAEALRGIESFTGQFDGIIDRYSTSRSELADWIDKVNSSGASYVEAYQTLDQQIERRVQLRDELAALDAPGEFASDKSAVLSVMDRAINAVEAAYRGVVEYQYNYRYWSYEDTPGWRTFENETAIITDDYGAALGSYEASKAAVIKRLSKVVPLPNLPE